jgi:hypothetical protein
MYERRDGHSVSACPEGKELLSDDGVPLTRSMNYSNGVREAHVGNEYRVRIAVCRLLPHGLTRICARVDDLAGMAQHGMRTTIQRDFVEVPEAVLVCVKDKAVVSHA